MKTEFSFDDTGFNNAQSTKDDVSYRNSSTPQIVQPSSANVTTTSILLENNLNASSDLISYADITNNNEWNIDQNDIKNWEICEANVYLSFNIRLFVCFLTSISLFRNHHTSPCFVRRFRAKVILKR